MQKKVFHKKTLLKVLGSLVAAFIVIAFSSEKSSSLIFPNSIYQNTKAKETKQHIADFERFDADSSLARVNDKRRFALKESENTPSKEKNYTALDTGLSRFPRRSPEKNRIRGISQHGSSSNRLSGLVQGLLKQQSEKLYFRDSVYLDTSSSETNGRIRGKTNPSDSGESPIPPLFINTTSLASVTVEEMYSFTLKAQGGTPSYRWTISSGLLPGGLSLDEETGVISGVALSEGQITLRIQVSDSGEKQDSADFRLNIINPKISSKETTEVKEEILPSSNLLSSSSVDTVAQNEQSITTDTVSDFEIVDLLPVIPPKESVPVTTKPISDLAPVTNLIARSSNAVVGLAWKNPRASKSFSYVEIRRATEFSPETPDEGELVYKGSAQNTLDRNLINSLEYHYSVFSFSDSGDFVLPDATGKASAIPNAVSINAKPDPFVDEVISFNPLSPSTAYGVNTLPDSVLGFPNGAGHWQGSLDVVSLNAKENDGSGAPYGGSITLRFTDNIVINGTGVDFTVFENAFQVSGTESFWMEPAIVEVSYDGEHFYRFPFDFIPHFDESGVLNLHNPFIYGEGFAGVNPVFSNGTNPDPTDPEVSGGDSFDLSSIKEEKLTWIQYVRIISTGDNWLEDKNGDMVRHFNEPPSFAASGVGNSGFDLDAVSAVHY